MKQWSEQLGIGPHLDAFVALRRDLHAHPELAFQEQRTAQRIAAWLQALGMQVETGIAGTGVVGVLTRGTSQRLIGLRADMDALPIQESNDFSHRSTVMQCMHACGHDGHVAMLLGAATILAHEDGFDGRVAFIFQPAEEGLAGAAAMLNDGLFERYPVESVYALHNWPGLPVGQFALRSGPIMAASLRFELKVHGRGTHAARPHRGIDPIPALCAIISTLQTAVAREFDSADSVVVSVTRIGAGTANNVVPDNAWAAGTARYSNPGDRSHLRAMLQRVANGVAAAHGASAEIEINEGYPATVNDARATQSCAEVMRSLVGPDHVHFDRPIALTSEDFSFMLQEKPGCYAWIGNDDNTHHKAELHHSAFDFNDAVIPLGVAYWVQLVRSLLKETSL